MTFLNSIKNHSKKHEFPFDHWEYDNALSEGAIKEIVGADLYAATLPAINWMGRLDLCP